MLIATDFTTTPANINNKIRHMGSDWLLHVKSNANQIVLIGLHIETISGIVSPHVYMFLYNKVNHSHILIGSYL